MGPLNRCRWPATITDKLLTLSVCALAGLVLAPQATARAARALTLRQEGERLVVCAPLYEATIAPDSGGRIVSFVVKGVEMTRLTSDGHGGLVEEVHTADFAFEVVEQRSTDAGLSVVLAADAGDLRVVKEYVFSADRPWFLVRLTFENGSRFPLSGDAAPALRNLVLPGGVGGAARQAYCLDRGLGAEMLSQDVLLSRMHEDPDAPLRWIAVAEPVSRRSFGFAILNDGCRPVPALRAQGGGVVFGWSYPAVPAGGSLVAELLAVPLEGFAAVAELNGRFAAESLPDSSSSPFQVRLDIMPLREEMRDVSAVTRTYDEAGVETDPCDSLLVETIAPLRRYSGRIAWPGQGQRPAWLVHEIYREGRRVGRFAVPVSHTAKRPPIGPAPAGPPELHPAAASALPSPGSLIPLTEEQEERGFLVWQFDGPSARREIRRLALALAEDERRTLFLGIRALRPLQKLRITLAGADTEAAQLKPVPPAAVYLWQVREDTPGSAHLAPLPELSLGADQAAWLALTVDAGQLSVGHYAARLIVSAEGVTSQVPLDLEVLPISAPGARAFGLWYIPAEPGGPLPEPSTAKLSSYGVSALTVPLSDGAGAVGSGRPVWHGRLRGLTHLSFTAGGGAAPPGSDARKPGQFLLPCPDPAWLVRAEAATSAALRGAVESGYTPALLCERLDAVSPDLLAPRAHIPFYLVRDGSEPGRAAEMLQSGAMDGSESIWLYLDLREADWRRAATEVRSAFWAAAWQGLAGAAVRLPPPYAAVDRESAVWHIVRDARAEVALWREARQAAMAARNSGKANAAALRRLGVLDLVVGTAGACNLPLRLERRAFRNLYRVRAPGRSRRLGVRHFAAARAKTLEIAARPEPALPATRPDLRWHGIPLAEEGELRWAIVAQGGESVWRQALAFQQAMRDAAGVAVPLSRAFPSLGQETPLLVWVATDGTGDAGLPESVREAIADLGGAQLATVALEGGATAALLAEGFDLSALLRTFHSGPGLFPTAAHVQ
ncbi:MAG: hypothetical protein ACYTFZ_00160 [Planctomycetota bacterium]|jgi:hypothetical protein